MQSAFKDHWKEYLMEAAGLGLFMLSAAVFGTILEYPGSVVHDAVSNPFIRRCIMGLAMGLTAIVLVFSPWGKQSGAHYNPAFTLTFYRLGKVAKWDAIFYGLFQFTGGVLGVLVSAQLLGHSFTDKPVQYVITVPGGVNWSLPFFVEASISFLMMLTVLTVSNISRLARFTGIFAGFLIMVYIIAAGPISGMSINPARSFASAFPSQIWTLFWIYLIAPPLGMLTASEIYLRLSKTKMIKCAKLHHHNNKRCIFLHCGYTSKDKSEVKEKFYKDQIVPIQFQYIMNIHK